MLTQMFKRDNLNSGETVYQDIQIRSASYRYSFTG